MLLKLTFCSYSRVAPVNQEARTFFHVPIASHLQVSDTHAQYELAEERESYLPHAHYQAWDPTSLKGPPEFGATSKQLPDTDTRLPTACGGTISRVSLGTPHLQPKGVWR
jgi:hypothetical protein